MAKKTKTSRNEKPTAKPKVKVKLNAKDQKTLGNIVGLAQTVVTAAEKKKDPIFWTGPVLAGNQLWVANSEGRIYRVSVNEGSATLFQELRAPISQPPVVANGTLYILDESGAIHAFR